VQTEQGRSVRTEDLPEVIVGGSCFRQAEQRLVSTEALRDVSHAHDRPRAHHRSPMRATPVASKWGVQNWNGMSLYVDSLHTLEQLKRGKTVFQRTADIRTRICSNQLSWQRHKSQ
jgi:hypothetical protein